MKVKVLNRNVGDYVRETKHDIRKVNRSYSAAEHPFEAEREYQRALNSVKLEKVFAKPFIGSLDGHRDSITRLAKHPNSLTTVASSAADGEVRFWQLATRKCIGGWKAHDGVVRGATFTPGGETLLTCGDDKTIKTWSADMEKGLSDTPLDTIPCKFMVTGITHRCEGDQFATCGENTQLWSAGRSVPVRTFKWGHDSVHYVRFNPVEMNILGAAASDNAVLIYDTRDVGPVRKVVMNLRSNSLVWNPMEAMVFCVANEDYNLYSFDMRKLDRPLNVHMDHISAVIDLDYSPTGKEIVSGSYDKTVRIFRVEEGHSREIYHTKRMQRLNSVLWSGDNKYIVSGSDEMCLRLWKARASEKLGVMKDRERVAIQYAEKLKEKYSQHPQVSRIARHRQLPKHIKSGRDELRTIKESQKRKEANRRKHAKPGAVPFISEKDKHIVEEME